MNKIQQQIEDLRKEIEEYNYQYYVLSSSLISDFDFDMKLKELEKLEAQYPEYYDKNSPTQRVGSDITKSFTQESHKYPMLSLANSYNREDVQDFIERAVKALEQDIEIVCELKFDGASISLTYINGRLEKALTRGDGQVGDNVTNNIKTIKSIPLVLKGENIPPEFEIRGEVFMPWNVFEELNKQRVENEEQPFANPRNATSGTLKLQDPKIVANRKLDAYFYYLMSNQTLTNEHYSNLKKCHEWGFKISPNIKVCKTIDEVFDYINYWDKERHNLPFATDGVVLKINSLNQQSELGFTSKFPRWAIAYKFQAEQAFSKLLKVSYQVGRTGAITPVANLEPVLLSGSTIQRASLYNEDNINNLDLHLNDTCIIEKGGEIIPKIVGVLVENRIENAERVEFIKYCPECNTPLVKEENESVIYCPNDNTCPPQIKGKIEHFMTRKAMNIAGGGPETVEALYDANLVRNIADLYDLKLEQLAKLDRWGERKAINFLNGIEASKTISFDKVLYAIGIRFVGETVAKKITAKYNNIDDLAKASVEDLLTVDEIGIKIAQSIEKFFQNEDNIAIINRLKEKGLNFEIDNSVKELKSNKLENKSIVLSGTFQKYSREELKQMIEENGGKNQSSVSAKTDYFLVGENVGPSKMEKANKLGIKIINEDDFLKILD